LKRGLKYISIYLIICLAIGYGASAVDFLLIELYSVDVKEEIDDLLDKNEKVLIDGGMLTLFLKDQMDDYSFDDVPYDYIDKQSEVSYLESSRFLIEKEDNRYKKKYNITIVRSNVMPIRLQAINKMNSLMIYNNIIFNSLAVLVGLLIVLKYNRIIEKVNKDRRMINNEQI
jgi:hypothetical protein